MEHDSECIFCKIAKGYLPSSKIYEDEGVLAFLDIAPVEKGHALVISKRRHTEALPETSDEIVSELLSAARKIGMAMIKAGFGGFNVVQNNYPDGGQAVPHIHFHVIPRGKGRTEPLKWHSGAAKYLDDAERESFRKMIAEQIV